MAAVQKLKELRNTLKEIQPEDSVGAALLR